MLDRHATYWTIAPFNQNAGEQLVEQAWRYDREHGVIAIGWDLIKSDIRAMSAQSLEKEMQKLYPNDPGAWSSLWAFYHRIKVGDYVIARTGRSTALGLGIVTSDAYRDDTRGQVRAGGPHPRFKPHFRNVQWISTEEKSFPHIVFTIGTVRTLKTHLEEVLRRYDDAGH
jgi:predicted Mrr-cat superfamily restriction endonuclease